MSDSETEAPLEQAIRAHLRSHGPKGWATVRSRFTEVSDSTFWRSVRRIRAGPEALPSTGEARRRLAAHVTSAVGIRPAPTSRRPVLALQLQQLFDDVDLLRSFAMKDGRIKNPHLFNQAIVLRERAIVATVRCSEAVLQQEEAAGFFEALIDEVSAESPATARRIMVRLAAFQNPGQECAKPPAAH
jgi:hypothetical protein